MFHVEHSEFLLFIVISPLSEPPCADWMSDICCFSCCAYAFLLILTHSMGTERDYTEGYEQRDMGGGWIIQGK